MSESKTSFFRQSGWLVIATVGGGAFMTLVQILAGAFMQPAEWGVFFTLLRVTMLLGIPAGGLQTVFAQQAAAAFSEEERRQLTATTRGVLRWTLAIWAVFVLGTWLLSDVILASLKIQNPAAMWMTAMLGLTTLWLPEVRGLLQGKQDFRGLGWTLILDGAGRFGVAIALVILLHGQAAAGMTSAFLGQVFALVVGAWLTKDIWLGTGAPVNWKPWIRRVVPLTLATGALLVLQHTDSIFVQSLFDKETSPLYMAGVVVGFALVQFTSPIAAVMFPKIARSTARSETTDALRLTLLGTAALGGLAAVAATLLPELPLKILYFRKFEFYVQAAPLVRWFVWCMLAVTLTNVLVTNLLARERYEIVPWLVLIAGGYVIALLAQTPALVEMQPFAALTRVVQTLGLSSLILFALAAWFVWGKRGKPKP